MFLSSFFDCLSISVIWCDQRPKQGGGFYSAGYLRQKEFVIEGERGKQRAGTSNLKTSPNREGQPPITCVSKKRRKEGKRGGGSMIMRDKCKKDEEGKNKNRVLPPIPLFSRLVVDNAQSCEKNKKKDRSMFLRCGSDTFHLFGFGAVLLAAAHIDQVIGRVADCCGNVGSLQLLSQGGHLLVFLLEHLDSQCLLLL
jgi:hypothetical protein